MYHVEIAGVRLKNPVITSSGTFGFGREFNEFYPISELGAVTTKGLTLRERPGNPPARIAEAPAGMLNSVGLQNPGVEAFVKYELPFLESAGATVIANFSGNTLEEFSEMAKILDSTSVAMLEVNVSCPNVKCGGIQFGTEAASIRAVTGAVKKATGKPVIIKLSPNVTDIAAMATAAEDGGADAVSLINTVLAMRIDINTRRPVLHNNTGGLSGPAVLPVAVRMVWQVYNAVKIPIIGMGGISSGEDAVEMMLAGATAVSVGSLNLQNPYGAYAVREELLKYFSDNGLRPSDITGAVKTY